MNDVTSNSIGELPAFIAKHGHPYDPNTDNYERVPFADDVISPGRSAFYNFHYYLTKVPPESIVGLIRHYTQPGDLILDPFCGSGMTGVATQAVNRATAGEQRYCILSDLSPAACHITANYTATVSADSLKHEYERVSSITAPDETLLYGTYHFEPAVGLYSEATIRNGTSSQLFSDAEDRGKEPEQWRIVERSEAEAFLGTIIESEHSSAKKWVRIPAKLLYVVWSDVYKCEGFKTVEMPTGRIHPRTNRPIVKKIRTLRGCGREIVARGANDKQADDGNNAFVRCPYCDERWMKGRVQRLNVVPVEECIEYLGVASGRTEVALKRCRVVRPVSLHQKTFIESLKAETIPFPYPNAQLDKTNPRYRRDSLGGKRIETYSDFFTKRNLWALASIWNAIDQVAPENQSALRFCFTSQVMRCSRLRRMKGEKLGEQLSGTLHIASETAETNVFVVFKKAVDDYCANVGRAATADSVAPLVVTGSATELKGIPDGSIDYIFSDPPFGANIYYSGVSLMWEAWLGSFTFEPLEAVMHRVVDGGYKRLKDYSSLMHLALAEMYRVLKPGRFATIEFNNSDGSVFQVIREGLISAGFEIQNMLIFDKVERTFAQIRSTTGVSEVVDKDVLFNVRKLALTGPDGTKDDTDLEMHVAEAVRQHLATLPERMTAEPIKYSDDHRTTSTINSMLMNTLIPKGVSVERLNLPFIERVCGRFFRKIGQRWYLRGEAVGGNGGELVSEEVSITDELSAIAWLRQKLHAGSKLIGELKPLWMKATGLLPAALSQSLVVETLLRENFWRDATSNRWREPTIEEREKINDDRALRVLHDADRLAAGALGRTPGSGELCEWIAVLFETCKELAEGDATAETHPGFDITEAYRLIVKLSHRLTPDGVEPGTLSAAQKQVRVAGQRLAAAAEDAEAAAPKRTRRVEDDKQTVFDL